MFGSDKQRINVGTGDVSGKFYQEDEQKLCRGTNGGHFLVNSEQLRN